MQVITTTHQHKVGSPMSIQLHYWQIKQRNSCSWHSLYIHLQLQLIESQEC